MVIHSKKKKKKLTTEREYVSYNWYANSIKHPGWVNTEPTSSQLKKTAKAALKQSSNDDTTSL